MSTMTTSTTTTRVRSKGFRFFRLRMWACQGSEEWQRAASSPELRPLTLMQTLTRMRPEESQDESPTP